MHQNFSEYICNFYYFLIVNQMYKLSKLIQLTKLGGVVTPPYSKRQSEMSEGAADNSKEQ